MAAQPDFRYDFEAASDLPGDVDHAALQRMDLAAYLLDDGIAVPGTKRRIGIDPLIGILPFVGDGVAALASLIIIVQAALLDVERSTLVRMAANVAVDFAGGLIPLAGDLFDAAWKANRRNVELAVGDLATESAEIEVGPEPA
ncbi:DUF4112 domain-containing protein [Halosimplex sp. J119]